MHTHRAVQGAGFGLNWGQRLLYGACSENTQKAEGSGRGHLRTHTQSDLAWFLAGTDNAIGSEAGQSFFCPVLPALVLHLGKNALVEQQVGAGGQDLLQAGLADCVVRDPQPLVAG